MNCEALLGFLQRDSSIIESIELGWVCAVPKFLCKGEAREGRNRPCLTGSLRPPALQTRRLRRSYGQSAPPEVQLELPCPPGSSLALCHPESPTPTGTPPSWSLGRGTCCYLRPQPITPRGYHVSPVAVTQAPQAPHTWACAAPREEGPAPGGQ